MAHRLYDQLFKIYKNKCDPPVQQAQANHGTNHLLRIKIMDHPKPRIPNEPQTILGGL